MALVMGGRPDEVDAPVTLLTSAERERAARFRHEADRHAFVAAHLLVRLCAAELLGVAPHRLTLAQVCHVHGPGHGRPYLEEAPAVGVSLSHTRGYVCAAAGHGRVGVDAERVPPGPLDRMLAGMALTPRERKDAGGNEDLIRVWARKEALIKRGELTLDELSARDGDWAGRHLLEWRAEPDILVAAITDTPARRAAIPG
ncbi:MULTISPECIES: 4'-phosphopantetheinyl transferase family protein [Nonomuraea]|uniref:4'-phosphopantetheinyl transferase superfamily protein n=1 Tax=Nonomuraea ferruginea TaxID=46174 RepID=A0ABT4T3E1_9ACTN|nr:4'-phosphopantetheinyl transferase superfamily protein [Nonomuraea ferruginea]MDA0644041.1 4'-phosphopantetheinyl transferase superfamily protein [Nonomuraea ferruginea]